jgi:3-methyladenine DNA glycosylase/8-oxoguanine DNA glycosylase
MFRLDEDHAVLGGFHTVDPRWKKSGRGRLMRSATLFEDVIKTVTSCNVTWPSTIIMNRRMCEIVGRKSASGLYAFPTAARLAKTRPQTLRARCSVGYRDLRIIELAKMFARDTGPTLPRKLAAKGIVWPVGKQGGFAAWLETPATPDDHVFAALMELPGVGPYAAANIMQLLGRYARLPLDTESIRHAKSILKFTGTDHELMRKLHAHYEPFGEHRFRSYWFELWDFYEAKRGPAWTWERETTGKTFTAALLAD